MLSGMLSPTSCCSSDYPCIISGCGREIGDGTPDWALCGFTACPSQAHTGRDMAGYLSSNGFKAMVEPLAAQQGNEKVRSLSN